MLLEVQNCFGPSRVSDALASSVCSVLHLSRPRVRQSRPSLDNRLSGVGATCTTLTRQVSRTIVQDGMPAIAYNAHSPLRPCATTITYCWGGGSTTSSDSPCAHSSAVTTSHVIPRHGCRCPMRMGGIADGLGISLLFMLQQIDIRYSLTRGCCILSARSLRVASSSHAATAPRWVHRCVCWCEERASRSVGLQLCVVRLQEGSSVAYERCALHPVTSTVT